MKQGTEKGWQ